MKIQNKLFFILFGFSLLLVTVLVLLMQWSIDKGMVEYVNTKEIEAVKPLVSEITKEYQKQHDWSTLRGKSKKFSDIIFSKLKNSGFIPLVVKPDFRLPPPDFMDGKPNFDEPLHDFSRPPLNDQSGYVLFDVNKEIVVGYYRKNSEYTQTPIYNGKINIGFLGIPKRNQIIDGYELDFLEQQKSYLLIIALVSMLLVTMITSPLARHVVGPINLIIRGMHQLTQGKYQQKIDLNRKDELGELSRDFNELALTLEGNENARKRWLANISHELRTPVAILRGELEAMLDGVRPLSKESIDSANDEVRHLQCLIDDLHQLTSADVGGMHYRKTTEDLVRWLNLESKKYQSYLASAGIKFEFETLIEPKVAMVFADTTRLCQLFDNIINNSINYAQASLLKISIKLDKTPLAPFVRITVEDDGIGVDDQHLPNLFEYLYRVDDSRNRKTGGTGLGLSICSHIVTAHQGKIYAQRSSLGGLAIVIELPISN